MKILPPLSRCCSLHFQAPDDDEARGPIDDLDGWRRERHRGREWLAWADAAQRALCRPGRPLPPDRAYDLGASGPAELFLVDEVEPLTLGTFREHLDARLAAGRPAWLAQVTTPLPEVRAFRHTFAGAPYAAYAAQQHRDVTDLEVANPCSRQPATRLVLVLWDRCAEGFRAFFDSRYTMPGSLADAAAQAIVGIAAEAPSPGAWAALGWTLRLSERGLAPPPPALPPPRALAEELLAFAARAGDLALARRALEVWHTPATREAAGAWSAAIGDRATLAELARHGTDVCALNADQAAAFLEARAEPHDGHDALTRALTYR